MERRGSRAADEKTECLRFLRDLRAFAVQTIILLEENIWAATALDPFSR